MDPLQKAVGAGGSITIGPGETYDALKANPDGAPAYMAIIADAGTFTVCKDQNGDDIDPWGGHEDNEKMEGIQKTFKPGALLGKITSYDMIVEIYPLHKPDPV